VNLHRRRKCERGRNGDRETKSEGERSIDHLRFIRVGNEDNEVAGDNGQWLYPSGYRTMIG
jgi:hypothetical protein